MLNGLPEGWSSLIPTTKNVLHSATLRFETRSLPYDDPRWAIFIHLKRGKPARLAPSHGHQREGHRSARIQTAPRGHYQVAR